MVGRPFWETAWWSGSKEVQNTIEKAVKNAAKGESFAAELPYWLSDGSERVSDFALTPARNEKGAVIFILPTGTDITERKQAEARKKDEAEIDRFFSEASVTLASSLDYEETLPKLTQPCVPTLADWAFLDLLDKAGVPQRVKVAHANPSERDLASRVAQFPARPCKMEFSCE